MPYREESYHETVPEETPGKKNWIQDPSECWPDLVRIICREGNLPVKGDSS